jgi:ABC-type nickel/cobalt efflux system permease component RcnA
MRAEVYALLLNGGLAKSASGIITILPPRAALLGLGLGMLSAIGPDHVCTLMTISIGAGNRTFMSAIKTGISWSVGHSFGMVIVCLVFMSLQQMAKIDQWSTYGDYFAGALMTTLGLYFLLFEYKYLEKTQEGTYVAKPCCSGHQHTFNHESYYNYGGVRSDDCNTEDESCQAQICFPCNHGLYGAADEEACEKQPLLAASFCERVPKEVAGDEQRLDFWGVIVGLVQGVCCPSCLLGVSFAGQFTGKAMTVAPLSILTFIVSLVVSSSICTGFMLCGLLSAFKCLGNNFSLSMGTIYRMTCCFTLVMGITWCILAHYNVLRFLDIAENLEHQGRAAEVLGVAH